VAFRAASGPRPVSLRFVDQRLERGFGDRYLADNLTYVRAAHVVAAAVWAFFGFFPLLVNAGDISGREPLGHVVITVGIGMGVTLVSLGLTFAPAYRRWWQTSVVGLVVISSVVSVLHRVIGGHPADWRGVIGLLFVMAFAYALLRLQYRYAAVGGALIIVAYNVIRLAVQRPGDIELLDADVYLVAFAVVGTAAAFLLERSARLLFLRERDVDRERARGDRLLSNILPEAIITELKDDDRHIDPPRIARRYPEATVLFADLVGFTEQASSTEPAELVAVLDDVFRRFDELADRFGLEKIKTVGDAYMAAAGVPEPRDDHVEAASEMALEIRARIERLRWPSGDPMSVRIGIACGPVVAGVIGRRKFAYDVWGDTVNTASRLEATARPGGIHVSGPAAERLGAGYRLSEPYLAELRGKGPTIACYLLGRRTSKPLRPVVTVPTRPRSI
jgi:class 3 adenylate cyclase